MTIIRRRVMIATTRWFLFIRFVVASCKCGDGLCSLFSPFFCFAFSAPGLPFLPPPGPAPFGLIGVRDEGGRGGISYGMYVFSVTLRLFCTAIIRMAFLILS